MKNLVGACLVAGGILVGTTVSATASPEDPKHPNGEASCIGLIAADHGRGIPDGTHMNHLVHGTKDYTDSLGMGFGEFISAGAQLHLGSHAVCGNE